MTPDVDERADDVAEQVRDAVAGDGDIRANVELITRAALTTGRLDLKRVRQVVRAVGQGASDAAHARPNESRQLVLDAVEGLQAALGHSAKTARLAIEEAAGRVDDYSEVHLKDALHDLGELESLTLDTLEESAAAARHTGGEMLIHTVHHLRRSGSRLGADVDAALRELTSGLPAAARETTHAGLDVLRETGARAAEAASGLFSGLAKALRSAAQPEPREPEPRKPEPRKSEAEPRSDER